MVALYDVDDVKLFSEFIIIIKEVVVNFDTIYNDKINSKEVLNIKKYIETMKKKKV